MSNTTILITGANGQDGHIAISKGLHLGYNVVALTTSIQNLPITHPRLIFRYSSPKDYVGTFEQILKSYSPSIVLHFAAVASSTSVNLFDIHTLSANLFLPLQLLNISFNINPGIRFFYPSSSYVFDYSSNPISEQSQKNPSTVYGHTKHYVDQICQAYRNKGYFVCNGYLFSHESRYRPSHSFAKRALANVKAASTNSPYCVDNWNRINDWSSAESVIDCIYKIMLYDKPSDYVIGSGRPTTVFDFYLAIVSELSLDPSILKKGAYEESPLFRLANPALAVHLLGWQPSTSITDVVKSLLKA